MDYIYLILNLFNLHCSSTQKDCLDNQSIKFDSISKVSNQKQTSVSTIDTLTKSKPVTQRRPLLVKQKLSFRYPDDDSSDGVLNTQAHLNVAESNIKEQASKVDPCEPSKEVECLGKEVSNTKHRESTEDLDTNTDFSNEKGRIDNDVVQVVTTSTPPPFVTRISFEDLKEEVRLMPSFPPPDFVRTGSDDSGTSGTGTRPESRAKTRYTQ